MFEITTEQLRGLTGVQLRELVARLCEAELRVRGAPASAVRWSGAHTAPDGGLDVECHIEDRQFQGDFVPRPRTGFQVKKPSMPPSKIAREMSPKGRLRPVFSTLAANTGCYIIVSLADNPAGNAAFIRQNAIREQLEPIRPLGDLRTDFYGCCELASWLRRHLGVQLWVRDKLGIPLEGWKPLGRWTNTPLNDSDELICKPGVSISLPGKGATRLDIGQGIQAIRDLLRTSDRAVRIVGLSGVGKTRIVQALFERSVGADPLDRSLAVYADLGTSPVPTPSQVVARLKAEGQPAILVLDNCPADAHSLLAAEVSDTPKVRLITIEYDIREDRPEVTTVIRIDAEGIGIVEVLVSRRYPALGQLNARSIAEFSGGNSRVALALANALEDNEDLSDFSHAQLFTRLFHQRGTPDEHLLVAARTLALVYSYSIAPDENGVDELATLAGLIGQTRQKLYAASHTLLERQLAQQRGHWRAILPPAVANRLAARGLDDIPIEELQNTLETLPNDRLLKSFGKRLGYLHLHRTAQRIVRSWLCQGGLLHAVEDLTDDRMQLLVNVAPAAPEAVLRAIEARVILAGTDGFFAGTDARFQQIAGLLGAIAYDADLFERCIALLVSLAIAQRREQPHADVAGRLCSLFALFMSGTEATPDTRERVLRRYLGSSRDDERRIGSQMLEVALKGSDGFSFAMFDFGARPRTFGYEPRTAEDHDQWFIRFVSLAVESAADEDAELSTHAREILANELELLILESPTLRPVLIDAARSLHNHRPWLEGWRAVRSIKHLGYPETDDEDSRRAIELLDELDDLLRPARLADQIRVYVCDMGHRQFSVLDECDDDPQSQEECSREAALRAFDLGLAACRDLEAVDECSQELFTGETGFLADFGKGMASGYDEPRLLWDRLVGYLQTAEDLPTHCTILCGALEGIHERDEALAKRILRESAENPALRPFIARLHLSVPASCASIGTFLRALRFDDTPLDQFATLAWQRPPHALPEALVRDLFAQILERPQGTTIVLTGLSRRIRRLEDGQLTFGSDLKRLGLIASTATLRDPSNRYNHADHRHLPDVLAFCLDDAELPQEATQVLEAFLARINARYAIMAGLRAAAAILVEKMPFRFLDGACLDPALEDHNRRRLFAEPRRGTSPLAGVNEGTLIEWCRRGDFEERLTALSQTVHPFSPEKDGKGVVFSGQARAILDAAQNPSVILGNFANSIRPNGWSGSLADVIAERCRPFEALLRDDRSHVRNAARDLLPRIKEWEHQERHSERDRARKRDQRFE